ncbi:MAG: hypothetical protein J5I90_08130 [Caldilineales bacterium]|nr:hypothetical protein [Caldilineales bacterium]
MTQTAIAVLGTLAEFHSEPIPFDLKALVDLVRGINPDLLCLDLSPERWQSQNFGDLTPDYRDALLPLADQTDIVVVPVGEDEQPPEPQAAGWRGRIITLLRALLGYLQKTAPGPDAINSGWRHDLANELYHLALRLGDADTEQTLAAHRQVLIDNILAAAERDPGARILVVVNVQHCHHIRPALAAYPGISVPSYAGL